MIAKYVERMLIARRVTSESAARRRRPRDQGHRGGPPGGGRGRRGPGERGRHHLRRQQGHPRAAGVHDPLHQRRDLRADAGGRPRPAPAAADDRPQHRAPCGPRSRSAWTRGTGSPPASRPRTAPPRSPSSSTPPPQRPTWCAPATCSRCATPRAACCAAPGTPRPPWTWPGWPGCRRRACCAEVVNDDGTMARLPELRAFADEHGLALISIEQLIEYRRRTERQLSRQARDPDPERATAQWQAFGYRHEIDGTEHIALVLGDVGDGEGVLVQAALGVPDRRRVRLAALRLRRAAGRGDGGHRGRGPRGRALPARARGPRDRAAEQAAGLRAAGRRRRHRGRQPRARPAGGRPRVLAPARRSSPTWACARCACSPTTRPRSPAWPAAAWTSPAGSRWPSAVTPDNLRYLIAKRDRLGHEIRRSQ